LFGGFIGTMALWDSHERKRLYGEAAGYLRFCAERWKYVRNGAQAQTANPPRIHGLALPELDLFEVPPFP
jgi:hypothetical protein